MVQKFRKKPVVIEAVQWNADKKNFDEVMNFMQDFHGNKLNYENAEELSYKSKELHIRTLEGVMTASNLDWIIKGVNGEFYPCKPDIFEKTYESADATERKNTIVLFDRSLLRDGVTNEEISNKITIINK
jgi:hypothetical protein